MKVVREYWPNGILKYESPERYGKWHGFTRWWYENGQPRQELPYKNGAIHGIRRRWFINGVLDFEEYYLYNERVSEEEYRKHQLITQLAGIEAGIEDGD